MLSCASPKGIVALSHAPQLSVSCTQEVGPVTLRLCLQENPGINQLSVPFLGAGHGQGRVKEFRVGCGEGRRV